MIRQRIRSVLRETNWNQTFTLGKYDYRLSKGHAGRFYERMWRQNVPVAVKAVKEASESTVSQSAKRGCSKAADAACATSQHSASTKYVFGK
jgi:hypothetical protein